MYCLVDFRNRPQYKYTFPKIEKARECLKGIKNNPLGVTVFHADGRREYFEAGLPRGFFELSEKNARIRRGCHVKYRIKKLNSLDGLTGNKETSLTPQMSNWQRKSALSLFMLGNRKFYACLMIMALAVFSISFLFQKKFGENAIARSNGNSEIQGRVAGAMDAKNEDIQDIEPLQLADEDVIISLLGKVEEKKHEAFEKEILRYIKGKPMEAMAPYIAQQPRIVAAFIVGIAMKESKFGVYAPHDASGQDCLNYWGYRGPENTTASGYSCFNSPEHAIQVIGKKINSLVAKGISNPAEMISWKCGSSCAGHGAENVRKWISDVGVNFYKINSKENS
ncbi:MAG: hypothetical protein WC831_03095 [Parcubacteria group bacterium]|jgi:hypothetical protein